MNAKFKELLNGPNTQALADALFDFSFNKNTVLLLAIQGVARVAKWTALVVVLKVPAPDAALAVGVAVVVSAYVLVSRLAFRAIAYDLVDNKVST